MSSAKRICPELFTHVGTYKDQLDRTVEVYDCEDQEGVEHLQTYASSNGFLFRVIQRSELKVMITIENNGMS